MGTPALFCAAGPVLGDDNGERQNFYRQPTRHGAGHLGAEFPIGRLYRDRGIDGGYVHPDLRLDQ
jgi:hypothetical protein